jgi:hypothetical protein
MARLGFGGALFAAAPAEFADSVIARQAARCAMEPGADRIGLSDRAGVFRKCDESRLNDVVNSGHIAERSTANTAHERSMSLDQCGECSLVASLDKSRKKRGIRLDDWRRRQALNEIGDLGDGNGGHEILRSGFRVSFLIVSPEWVNDQLF